MASDWPVFTFIPDWMAIRIGVLVLLEHWMDAGGFGRRGEGEVVLLMLFQERRKHRRGWGWRWRHWKRRWWQKFGALDGRVLGRWWRHRRQRIHESGRHFLEFLVQVAQIGHDGRFQRRPIRSVP